MEMKPEITAANNPSAPRLGTLIEARNIERVYGVGSSAVYALRDVTLGINRGEYISLMGPSGSGKTTFFNIIGALDFPTGGTITLGGHDLRGLVPAQLAYLRCVNVGYIFQNYNLIEVVSALRNVMLPMRFLGLGEKEAEAKAAAETAAVLHPTLGSFGFRYHGPGGRVTPEGLPLEHPNLVEQIAGDSSLIGARSRATVQRPFTVVLQKKEPMAP